MTTNKVLSVVTDANLFLYLTARVVEEKIRTRTLVLENMLLTDYNILHYLSNTDRRQVLTDQVKLRVTTY